MTTVIVPSLRARGEPTPAGRLAASLLSVTVAGLADPQRFRRGKAYLIDHAVTRLEVSEGVLRGTVIGGRPDPYHVTITVETMPRPHDLGSIPERSHVARLIPRGEELLSTCSCPDWDDPCKHGVATILAFAAELGTRPELLAVWRCDDGEEMARTKVGGRARADRHLRLVSDTPPRSPFDTPEWHAFLGDGLTIPHCSVSDEPLSMGAVHVDNTDVATVIRSAWQMLARYGASEQLS